MPKSLRLYLLCLLFSIPKSYAKDSKPVEIPIKDAIAEVLAAVKDRKQI
ncbi:MAG: hypothetical protein NTY88_04425 [Bacteroidetes bacterium]|nr:hypothetical protein [Bacteroidota bacterium]